MSQLSFKLTNVYKLQEGNVILKWVIMIGAVYLRGKKRNEIIIYQLIFISSDVQRN